MRDSLQKLKVLFLCMGNSCRSQMAEAWTRHLKGDVIEPFSAGIEPRPVDPKAITVMAEAGVDISAQRSKSIDELPDVAFDYVVTVCDQANEQCPFFPGPVKRVHVGFDDPPALARTPRPSARPSRTTGACATRSGRSWRRCRSGSSETRRRSA